MLSRLSAPTSGRTSLAPALLIAAALAAPVGAQEPSAPRWPPVPPVDTARIHPSDFADDELDLPFYLIHFHRVANGVVESGDHRGFIGISIYRAPQYNHPHNMRIMENILALAFFYTTKRPWNPYYGSEPVRVRLEAALTYWCDQQHVDGKFAEYAPREWNLAATAFATKFMARTLALLRDGPPIDAALHRRVIAANRKAIDVVLDDPELYEHGKKFTNQYTNVYAGGFTILDVYPDAGLRERLVRRLHETAERFQSPAGYFYEERGPDWGYNLGTHQSNTWISWHYTRGTPLEGLFVEEQRRFFEWMRYNAVPENDGRTFTLNRGIETRQRHPTYDVEDESDRLMLGEAIPALHAFLPTRDEVQARIRRRREELAHSWPRVPELTVGESSYNAYAFLHRTLARWHPTAAQREASRASLPCHARERFVHRRSDARESLHFTFVRRPAYYAAFNFGRLVTWQQRYGLGLLWRPGVGTVLLSNAGTREASWGTRAGDAAKVYEAADLAAELRIDDRPVQAGSGAEDLPDGRLTIRYPLGSDGHKTLDFEDDAIAVAVAHPRPFREQVPLIVGAGDALTTGPDGVVLTRAGRALLDLKVEGGRVSVVPGDMHRAGGPSGIQVVSIAAERSLRYRLRFPGAESN